MPEESDPNAKTRTHEPAEGAGASAPDEQAPPPASRRKGSTVASRGIKGRKKKKKEKKHYDSFSAKLWHEWIRPLGTIFIVMGLFRLIVVDWYDVPSGSMEPTIMTGDRILVQKYPFGLRVPFTKDTWIAHWGEPERGDIVVCYSPDEGDEVRLVKRIVAGPGDVVELRNGFIYINGEETGIEPIEASNFPAMDPVDASKMEFFIETVEGRSKAVMLEPKKPQLRTVVPFTVPEDSYVIIGDNRDNSKDSRGWNEAKALPGQTLEVMPLDRIHGRAFRVAVSLDKWVPRWGRFFHDLDEVAEEHDE